MSKRDDDLTEIHGFWEQQAEKHGTDLQAVMPDSLLKELELSALKSAMDASLSTLEAGCGNGVNLVSLAADFTANLVGFDYSDAMISAAKRADSDRGGQPITFHVANILDDLSFMGSFPQIYTDRCLINLPSLKLQLDAVERLVDILEPGGRLFLVECTQQGLHNVNVMREHADLPTINNHWHNLYLDEKAFLDGLPGNIRHIETVAFSSLYYLISRVFNAKLTPEGEAPSYTAAINKIAAQLPSVGDFGPHKLFILEK